MSWPKLSDVILNTEGNIPSVLPQGNCDGLFSASILCAVVLVLPVSRH